MEVKTYTGNIAEDLINGGFVVEVYVNGERAPELDAKGVPTRDAAEAFIRGLGGVDPQPGDKEWLFLTF